MAPARLASITQDDRERLKHVLLESDSETQRFLGPLLALEPVQHLLLSFVKDPSRSFMDHVWDPVTQGVLKRLREAGIDGDESQAEVTSVFETTLLQQSHAHAVVDGRIDTEPDLMADVNAAQADGKAKFKRGDYYAAMNAFKKSVLALLKYHEHQYYGQVIEPREWEEDDLRQRYVPLCCNVAVCGIKLKDYAVIRLYATKALRVDSHSSKAIYALAKVNLLEQRYEDAQTQAKKGMDLYPDNDEFAKLLKGIENMEIKHHKDRQEMLALKAQNEKLEAEARTRREQQEAEKRAKFERTAEITPLPALHADDLMFQRLNTYFMRIKQSLRVMIDQLHNPDNGEPPLFECNMINGSTGVALATGITASSKKSAKQAAAKVAVKKLWDLKREAGKLLPEDQQHWEEFEKAQREGKVFLPEPSQKRGDEESVVAPHDEDGVVRLTAYERHGAEPVVVLNQLHSQRRLEVTYDMEDVAPSKIEPLFKCTCVINGETRATATAPGKKKAKAEAARLAMNAAVEGGIIQYLRSGVPVNDAKAETEQGKAAEVP